MCIFNLVKLATANKSVDFIGNCPVFTCQSYDESGYPVTLTVCSMSCVISKYWRCIKRLLMPVSTSSITSDTQLRTSDADRESLVTAALEGDRPLDEAVVVGTPEENVVAGEPPESRAATRSASLSRSRPLLVPDTPLLWEALLVGTVEGNYWWKH